MQIIREIDIDKFIKGFNEYTCMPYKQIYSEKDAIDYIKCINESDRILTSLMIKIDNTSGDFSFNLGFAFAAKLDYVWFHNEVIDLINSRIKI